MADVEHAPKHLLVVARSLSNQPTSVIEARLYTYLAELMSRSDDDRQRRRQAEKQGFFWLPCFLCGNWFAGNDKKFGHVRVDGAIYRLTCETCAQTAAELNELWPEGVSRSWYE